MPDTAQRILEVLGVMKSDCVFLVGSHESRVTIYSQQCRALNLVWALQREGRLAPPLKRIGVVGGGIAGTTAALAAAIAAPQATVELYERGPRLMHLQDGCKSRWVHPHIIEWPEKGWDVENAGLPIMTWSAGSANAVVAQLRSQFTEHPAGDRVNTRCGVPSVELDLRDPSRPTLIPDGGRPVECDLVILTVGFGREAAGSYWHDDNLHQRQGSCLISGTGDGGLIDLLRYALEDFEHSEVPELLDGGWLDDDVRQRILDFDRRKLGAEETTKFYEELEAPEVDAALLGRLAERSKKLWLNGTQRYPFDGRAARLNTFLVSRLYKHERFKYIANRAHQKSQCVVELQPVSGGRLQTLEFDHVVLRHGPPKNELPALEFEHVEPRLSSDVARSLPRTTDISREPAWEAGFLRTPRLRGKTLLEYRSPLGIRVIGQNPLKTHIFKTFFDDSSGRDRGLRIPVGFDFTPAADRTLAVVLVDHHLSTSDGWRDAADAADAVIALRCGDVPIDVGDLDGVDLCAREPGEAVRLAIVVIAAALAGGAPPAPLLVTGELAHFEELRPQLARLEAFAEPEFVDDLQRLEQAASNAGERGVLLVLDLPDYLGAEADVSAAARLNMPVVHWKDEAMTDVALPTRLLTTLLGARQLRERVAAAQLEGQETCLPLYGRPSGMPPELGHGRTVWVYNDPPIDTRGYRRLREDWAEREARPTTIIGLLGS